MEIRKTSINDLNTIMNLYSHARKFMEENKNPTQWANYPPKELLEDDIEKNNSYVCVENGEIVGTFFFKTGDDPTYLKIFHGEWLNDKPYGVIHRITSSKKGVGTFCLKWCFEKCSNIRIDTHEDNIPMQNLLKKNNYKKCGIIYIENGEERIAFHKVN